jgi:PhnB protein
MTAAEDKRAIRAAIEDRAAALRSKDVKALSRVGTRDNVVYSLAPPLVSNGGLEGVRAWFASWDGPMGYEMRDLEVSAGERVAFAHCLAHMTGRRTDGTSTDLWFRLTLGLEKRGEGWKISHEHHSTPFLMDGSFRAAIDLKP